MVRILVGFVFLLFLGCSSDYSTVSASKSHDLYAPMQEKQRAKNKYLAYTHRFTVTVKKSELSRVFTDIVETCLDEKEYKCLVMHSEQAGGEYSYANIQLRVSPKGVATYKSLISKSGDIEQQSTSAEDLTDSVIDIEKRLEMLSSYQAKLRELESNPNINIESLIKVASEMSEIQTQIEYSQGQKANLYQRISMDVLDISLKTIRNETIVSPIGDAFSEFGENLAEGIAIFITTAAYLIPWVVLVVFIAWFFRYLWVRSKRKTNS
ncbi:DUF4349 domain-containing protein [Teredinibacter turnerae]|uniref:DUF4349 domain-containing protein n=1 Tax=Teredinibacter turnerae TaxID=2426 RepID=UPI0005F86F2D|nr:DUF4349 domain-containing protein [Teredinibacter turnerae]